MDYKFHLRVYINRPKSLELFGGVATEGQYTSEVQNKFLCLGNYINLQGK